MTTIKFRPVQLTSQDDILFVFGMRKLANTDNGFPEPPMEKIVAEIARHQKIDERFSAIGEIGDEPAVYILLGNSDYHEQASCRNPGHIFLVCVDPKFQRRTAARDALRWSEHVFISRGQMVVTANTMVANNRTKRFAEKIGGVFLGHPKEDGPGATRDYLWKKDLKL